jgi:long-chain-acyl-CoA dehydrogenase
VAREIAPHYDDWEKAGGVPRAVWRKAGEQGFLAMEAAEEYGALGSADFRYNAIISEELAYVGAPSVGFGIHTDMAVPYILLYGTPEQQARWVPGIVSGELIVAIAITEPDTGSDVAAIRTSALREGDHYRLNGQKTFISNGLLADLVVVACKTDPAAGHRGISLLVVERGMAGFERGRRLEKVGLHAQDTAELFFNEVQVPAANLLGAEGKGFYFLMQRLAQERLTIAVGAVAGAEQALEWTKTYCRERQAFGKPLTAFQNTRFRLAEMQTEVEIGRVFLDHCIMLHVAGKLSAEKAAMAKWWLTDMQGRVVDQCVQLHGGYGYMLEYPIARAWVDARAQRIYGGTNEIMKELIGRTLS